ncbi:hypothetical protein [Rhodopseudomonas sp. P2A-2r]|uniref:hypothetical protein n=1 Tax=Rhodopseudomonas sp. P2A-2r TaxID=2991972 RepID=UPI0029FF0FCC|nr:hypothetical protein [Rhodopseudomonas sp. P2A-2r]
MDVQPTLFGEWAMVKEWGRIGRGAPFVHQFIQRSPPLKRLARTNHEKTRPGISRSIEMNR